MSGPNRKMRRAMEAQVRKSKSAAGSAASTPVGMSEAVLQRMYDNRTMEVHRLERELARQQAMTAGIMIEAGLDEIKVTQATLDALGMGVVAGFNPVPLEDGVLIELVYAGEGEDADDSEAE